MQQLALGLARERLKRQLTHRCGYSRPASSFKPPRGQVPLAALGHCDQERRALGEPEQPLGELHRSRIRPVQVLERQRERTVCREPADELDHDLERAVLERLRREFGQPRSGLDVEREPEQRAEIRVPRSRLLTVEVLEIPA